MSTASLVIGTSGSGKSASLRNLNPAEVRLIQVVRKPLPFKADGWSYWDKETNPGGNILVTDHWETIIAAAKATKRKKIIVDDFQYMLANEYMRRSDETGYQKFTDIGKHAWEVIGKMSELAEDVRVYVLAHSDETETGSVRMKTIGKLLDEKICPEGMFSIVLRSMMVEDRYVFSTRTNGSDVCKSPMGLFTEAKIENDLAAVDAAICAYYGIQPEAPTTKPHKEKK